MAGEWEVGGEKGWEREREVYIAGAEGSDCTNGKAVMQHAEELSLRSEHAELVGIPRLRAMQSMSNSFVYVCQPFHLWTAAKCSINILALS